MSTPKKPSLISQLNEAHQALEASELRLNNLSALANGQAKRLESLTKSLQLAQAKTDGWKEIALELIEERKEVTTINNSVNE